MKKYVEKIFIGGAMLASVPMLAFAQVDDQIEGLEDVATSILDFINNILVPLVFAIAFLVFIWGVFKTLIAKGDDEDSRKAGRQLMLWGIIAFFVMVSVWGFVNILVGTFNLDSDIGDIPEVPGARNR